MKIVFRSETPVEIKNANGILGYLRAGNEI